MANAPLILVIDDDPDFLMLTRLTLERAGYRVAEASSPSSALKAIDVEMPNVIISDVMMNTTDAGFQLARRIKGDQQLQHIPLIIVSAISSKLGFDFRPSSSEEASAMRADAFLAKPVKPDELLGKVHELLERAQAR